MQGSFWWQGSRRPPGPSLIKVLSCFSLQGPPRRAEAGGEPWTPHLAIPLTPSLPQALEAGAPAAPLR